MVHHPVILVPKLIVFGVLAGLLCVLHGRLSANQFQIAVVVCVAVFVVFVAVLWTAGFKMLSNPNSALGKAMTLGKEERAEDGYVASPNVYAALVGSSGKAMSPLRPSGTALVEGKRVSVITAGEFIAAGANVEITEAAGARVVVREVAPANPSA